MRIKVGPEFSIPFDEPVAFGEQIDFLDVVDDRAASFGDAVDLDHVEAKRAVPAVHAPPGVASAAEVLPLALVHAPKAA